MWKSASDSEAFVCLFEAGGNILVKTGVKKISITTVLKCNILLWYILLPFEAPWNISGEVSDSSRGIQEHCDWIKHCMEILISTCSMTQPIVPARWTQHLQQEWGKSIIQSIDYDPKVILNHFKTFKKSRIKTLSFKSIKSQTCLAF